MKKKLLLIICMCLIGGFCISTIADVEAKVVGKNHTYADKKGNTFYVTVPTKGLYKYNMKSNIISQIKSSKIGKNPSIGFSHPTAKGKYIYVTWNKETGTAYDDYRVCRISKSGKIKELAKGLQPVIVGNKIYYRKAKKETIYGRAIHYETNKWMCMNLNGSHKKTVKKIKIKKRSFGKYKVYSKYLGDTGSSGNHMNDNCVLYLKKSSNQLVKLKTWFMS